MNNTSHKRSPVAGRAIAAAAALLLGGGGLIAINVTANAGQNSGGDASQDQTRVQNASTIACPEVVDRISEVPQQARQEVDRNLAQLDNQVGDAYERLVQNRATAQRDGAWVQNSILGPLKQKRSATIDRITNAIGRWTSRPQGLQNLAGCQMKETGTTGGDGQSQDNGAQDNGGQSNNGGQDNTGGQSDNGGQGDNGQQGPSPDDFVDITTVQPNIDKPQQQDSGSGGTFTSECGVNENGKFNSDNVIAAPGVDNGAHHTHDYVGNQDTSAASVDDSLAKGQTTCKNQGDQSAYFWPVMRLQNAGDEFDANDIGGGKDGNVGKIQRAQEADIVFRGNPVSKVEAMPRFLRVITGDAKSFTNGDKNANASWSCTGFEDRQLKDKYPLCPDGSKVVRSFDFPSCWDGQNIDSADHRSHIVFPDGDGACPDNFKAVPQLTMRLVYDLPNQPVFAVDSFPEQLHKPITDHNDFINVFSDDLMQRMVDCINQGQDCKNN